MNSVHVIGSPVACTGFSLAGFPAHEVATPRDAAAVLSELVRRDDIGIVLVEQSVLSALGAAAERELTRRPSPVIVPFPGPTSRAREQAPESLILELLQRAIGYRVRL